MQIQLPDTKTYNRVKLATEYLASATSYQYLSTADTDVFVTFSDPSDETEILAIAAAHDDSLTDEQIDLEMVEVAQAALLAAKTVLLTDGSLDEMTDAMQAVYVDDGRRIALLSSFLSKYNAATEAERKKFNAAMFVILQDKTRR